MEGMYVPAGYEAGLRSLILAVAGQNPPITEITATGPEFSGSSGMDV
jgi:hypothetical protein